MAKFSEVVQGRIDADQEFQTSIANLTDAEKATKIAERRAVLIEEEGDKALTISEDQKRRAEKAEEERERLQNDPRLKGDGDKSNELTPTDVFTFTNAGVTHPDDIATVMTAAKALGLDKAGALANPIVQAQIASDKEKRASAAAADKGDGGRGGAAGDSDAQFLQKLAGGYIPPAGSPDAEREWKLRRQNSSVGR